MAALYEPLWREVAWLFAKWKTYVRLFGTSEDDLAILNRAAGSFVALVQTVMIGDLLLGISRLTDSKGTGQRTNLSLDALVFAIDAQSHEKLRRDAETCLADAGTKAAFAREWRNRQIAHLDLRTALGDHAEPLTPYTRGQVQEALNAIARVLNTLRNEFSGGSTLFDDPIEGPGGAESLIARLRDGIELRDWRRLNRRNGGTGILPPEV